MERATEKGENVIQWILLTQLDDLDFADDIALLSHTQKKIKLQNTLKVLDYLTTKSKEKF